jgi:Amt family ammonium transporter
MEATSTISAADTAWLMVSTALVLMMTPALALFYGGLVRAKNALNTMMMSFAAFAVAGISWVFVGYTLAFSGDGRWIGNLDHVLLQGVGLEPEGTVPHLLFMAFQGTFAVITAALISGAVVERMRFSTYLLFIGLWVPLVYAPLCHWVWGGGWLAALGALDFAGGTVVHINAAAAALVVTLTLGQRRDYGRQALLPHNVPLVLLGAGLLWVGWFGFNAGSALGSNQTAVLAFVNTLLAPMAALATWMLLDHIRSGRITAVGAATGIVVGLVAITPAAGFVGPMAALAVGAVAAVPSHWAILRRSRLPVDDSLDVVAAHGLGGVTGALLTGVLARAVWGGVDGLIAGSPGLVLRQLAAIAAAALFSGLATWALLRAIMLFVPLRAGEREERTGLDVPLHGEEAYTSGEGAILVRQRTKRHREREIAARTVELEPVVGSGG